MPRLVLISITSAVMAALFAACTLRHEPPAVYEPPITMEDLATGVPAPDNGYMLLSDERTTGRFTCALAVVKLVLQEGQEDDGLVFKPLRDEEQAHWTQALRGLDALLQPS